MSAAYFLCELLVMTVSTFRRWQGW